MEEKIEDILRRRCAKYLFNGEIFYTKESVVDALKEALRIHDVSGRVCPKCGCADYEEWEELEYEKGGDDPMYGGELLPMKFTRCGECD